MSVVLVVLAVVTVAFGGFAFAVDRALVRISPSRIEALATAEGRRSRTAKALVALHRRRDAAHDALVLGGLGAQQAAAALIVVDLALAHEPDLWLFLAIPVTTIVSFVLERVVAAALGRLGPERLLRASAYPAMTIVAATGWLAKLLTVPARAVRGPVVADDAEVPVELREILDRAEAGEVIEADEARMISWVVDFGDTIVREVMTARPDMQTLSTGDTLEAALELAVGKGLSRIPVCGDGVDDIVGVLYTKDLLGELHAEKHATLGAASMRSRRSGGLVRPAHFVPEQKRVADMLAEMRAEKFHMAIVVDEYGGTAGLVTLEDLLEEIVGDISDEYDTDEAGVVACADGSYEVPGRFPLGDLEEFIGVEVDLDDVDTVGGAVLHLLGRVPAAGDTVVEPVTGIRLQTLRMAGHRVELVRLFLGSGSDADGAAPGDTAELGDTDGQAGAAGAGA